MDDDFLVGIRNRIAGLCLVPITALCIVCLLAIRGLSDDPLQLPIVLVSTVGVLVTAAVGWMTIRAMTALWTDVRQSAEIMARRELAPARWEEPRRSVDPQEASRHAGSRPSFNPDLAHSHSVPNQPDPEVVPQSVEHQTAIPVEPNVGPPHTPPTRPGAPVPPVGAQVARQQAVEPEVQYASDPADGETQADTSAAQQVAMTSIVRNLVKRIQSMLDRQIDLVDELEAKEEDPTYLEKLFKIDHLANRMRRNADGLIVLSGGAVEQRIGGPVPILDVLRVSIGEVEEHDRVELVGSDEASIASGAALPLAHMAAELIENAIEFSPPTASVKVVGRMHPDSTGLNNYEILVVDNGIGLGQGQLVEANRQLSEPMDLAKMSGYAIGLSVVGRLAASLGATVVLANNAKGQGATASIVVPATLLATKPSDANPASGQPQPTTVDNGLPVLQPVTTTPPATQVETLSHSGLPVLDRSISAPQHGAASPDRQLSSTEWPARFPQPPAPGGVGGAQQAHPSRPSHRQPGEIETMMRRYRQGQAGVSPVDGEEHHHDE